MADDSICVRGGCDVGGKLLDRMELKKMKHSIIIIAGIILVLFGSGIAYAALNEVDKPVPASVTIIYGLAGDVNQDGQVDTADLVIVSDSFNTIPPVNEAADVNCDGIVDIYDLVLIGIGFGQ